MLSVVIPKNLRADMKARIHSSHLGAESCLRRARECIYWPGMLAEIQQYISACEICRKFDTTSQPNESLVSHEVPSRPWERVGADIFTLHDKDYLVTIDYYSNFWEVDRLPDTKASTAILKLKSHFARYGIPDQVVSNNGPQFTSKEFATFAKTWDFEHLTSSPGNSKANGKAESGVKTAKRLFIRAGTDPYLAFLGYRNTPIQAMTTSPAQRLLGRRTKMLLPTAQSLLMPKTTQPGIEKSQLKERQRAQAKYYNRDTKDLPTLSEEDVVRMKPFKLGAKSWPKAQVTARLDEWSYTVETENGTVYCRNRQHLKKTSESPIQPIQSDPVDDTNTSKPDVPSIPTLTAELVDKPLGSTSCESSSDQHQRPQRDRRPPGVP